MQQPCLHHKLFKKKPYIGRCPMCMYTRATTQVSPSSPSGGDTAPSSATMYRRTAEQVGGEEAEGGAERRVGAAGGRRDGGESVLAGRRGGAGGRARGRGREGVVRHCRATTGLPPCSKQSTWWGRGGRGGGYGWWIEGGADSGGHWRRNAVKRYQAASACADPAFHSVPPALPAGGACTGAAQVGLFQMSGRFMGSTQPAEPFIWAEMPLQVPPQRHCPH